MHIRTRIALPAALLAAAAFGIIAAPASAEHAKAPKAQVLHIVIKDVTTPDGTGPALIGPGGTGAKSLFTAHVGRPVVLTIVNQSTTMHSFTVKALGLNTMILVGAKATVKFTPKKTGALSWVCIPPCGTWVMDNAGYMKGSFTVAK